jgi:hypothetical protein
VVATQVPEELRGLHRRARQLGRQVGSAKDGSSTQSSPSTSEHRDSHELPEMRMCRRAVSHSCLVVRFLLELDYQQEAENSRRFAAAMQASPLVQQTLVVPKVGVHTRGMHTG